MLLFPLRAVSAGCTRLLVAVALSAAALAASEPELAPAPALLPCDTCVPGVINFGKLDSALWRGAQPSAEGFQALERMGVRTVVSFRHERDDYPLLKGTRLHYVRIPSFAFHPSAKHLAAFLKVMEDKANWPVFIHCAEGRDRTGYNAAAYRIVVQGWTAEAALAEMHNFHFNTIWFGNPGFIRRLQAERLRQSVRVAPKPVFQAWPE